MHRVASYHAVPPCITYTMAWCAHFSLSWFKSYSMFGVSKKTLSDFSTGAEILGWPPAQVFYDTNESRYDRGTLVSPPTTFHCASYALVPVRASLTVRLLFSCSGVSRWGGINFGLTHPAQVFYTPFESRYADEPLGDPNWFLILYTFTIDSINFPSLVAKIVWCGN